MVGQSLRKTGLSSMGPHLWGLQVVLVGVLALGLRMVVFHGHFPSLAPPGGPLCLAGEEVGTSFTWVWFAWRCVAVAGDE